MVWFFTRDSHPNYNTPVLGAHEPMDQITVLSGLLSCLLPIRFAGRSRARRKW